MSDSARPHRRQPTRLPRPWDSPGENTGVGCHFLLQCMKVKNESEVTQSCLTLRNPMDYSLPGSSIHGIFQARVLEWGAIAFSGLIGIAHAIYHLSHQGSPKHILFKESPAPTQRSCAGQKLHVCFWGRGSVFELMYLWPQEKIASG